MESKLKQKIGTLGRTELYGSSQTFPVFFAEFLSWSAKLMLADRREIWGFGIHTQENADCGAILSCLLRTNLELLRCVVLYQ